ncbi:MAG: bifunctional diaminohydroxyphosphoribosylaminopyrimidine deaminase/5-amino-6-(5-phosphoribosylamino)uracil reductase RibD [Bacteroidia bacterium]
MTYTMPDLDSIYLERCLQLARLGGSKVQTNPMVGAVVVKNQQIIGEGYHRSQGTPHAEVNAVRSVKQASLLSQSTLYVSLEPCCIYGKTPPCTDLILKHQIPKVVIGTLDPNPLVAGGGVARLRENGVEVVMAADPRPFQALNRVFFFNQAQHRPFISLKWAQSKDGFIATYNPLGQAVPTKITDYSAAIFTHKLRAEHQAILVGTNTANIDNPRLDTRLYPGSSPQPIVLGRENKLKPQLRLRALNRQVLISKPASEQSLVEWLNTLYQEQQIASILVEGGSNVLNQFIAADCYEAIYRYSSPKTLEEGVAAPSLEENYPWSGNAQLGPDRLDWFQRPL